MLFGYFICLDTFLNVFTTIPLRAIYAILSLPKYGLLQQSHVYRKALIQFFLLLGTCVIVLNVDSSQMYHSIRGQSTLKLYVIFNVLEICDKLCSAFGSDILSSLYDSDDYSGFLLRSLISWIYMIIHTMVLFYQVMTLNVAINSHSNALLSLLVSNQFVEIKGSVFKRFTVENLFQLSMADIIERFQLIIYLGLIFVRNALEFSNISYQWNWFSNLLNFESIDYQHILIYSCFLILGSEIVIDWIKHAFITKFNMIKPQVYGKYLEVLSSDYIKNYSDILDKSSVISDKIQFMSLPITCLFLRIIIQTLKLVGVTSCDTLKCHTIYSLIGFCIWFIVFGFKIQLSAYILQQSKYYLLLTETDLNQQSDFKQDQKEETQFDDKKPSTPEHLIMDNLQHLKFRDLRSMSVPNSPAYFQLEQDKKFKDLDKDNSSVMLAQSPTDGAENQIDKNEVQIEAIPINLNNIERFTMYKNRIP